MIYDKALPRIDNIMWLVKLARPFPTTASEITKIAKNWNFSQSTQDFLKIFPEDEVFEDGDDFLTRCETVELLSREARKMPAETVLSQQD